MVTQPVVFGYTPPISPAPVYTGKAVQRNTSDINSDIKVVTQAIKESIMHSSSQSSRNAYIIAGVACLIIAGLGYQNYTQREQIDLLEKSLSHCQNNQPVCPSVEEPSLSPEFETTSLDMRWSLDKSECHQILTYEDSAVDIAGLFKGNKNDLINHLSEEFEEMKVIIQNREFEHEDDISRFSALIYHNCQNTLESLREILKSFDPSSPVFSQFSIETLRNAVESAVNARNSVIWDELLNALKHKGMSDKDLPIGHSYWVTDPSSPKLGSEVTVTINLKNDLPVDSIYNPVLFAQNAAMQNFMSKSIHTKNYICGKLLAIFSRGNNEEVSKIKSSVVQLIASYDSDNPTMIDEILAIPDISQRIDQYHLRQDIQSITSSRKSHLQDLPKQIT